MPVRNILGLKSGIISDFNSMDRFRNLGQRWEAAPTFFRMGKWLCSIWLFAGSTHAASTERWKNHEIRRSLIYRYPCTVMDGSYDDCF